jgi:hypothetical protein
MPITWAFFPSVRNADRKRRPPLPPTPCHARRRRQHGAVLRIRCRYRPSNETRQRALKCISDFLFDFEIEFWVSETQTFPPPTTGTQLVTAAPHVTTVSGFRHSDRSTPSHLRCQWNAEPQPPFGLTTAHKTTKRGRASPEGFKPAIHDYATWLAR